MEERLQKLLSAAGVCSRRKAEEYLQEGRVRVNGAVAHLGDKADPQRDVITLNGQTISDNAPPVYLMLHKPRGYVTTLSDERGRKTAAELVADCGARVWPVGRLDLDSEGLLLFTNDGDLTNRLIHPRHGVEKEYLVWVTGDMEAALPILRGPMELDGVPLAPVTVLPAGGQSLRFLLRQGKNRQIRRMCQQAGLNVTRLKRLREGPLTLGQLPKGQWRPLTEEEVRALKAL